MNFVTNLLLFVLIVAATLAAVPLGFLALHLLVQLARWLCSPFPHDYRE